PGPEGVAEPGPGQQVARRGWVGLDLAPQALDAAAQLADRGAAALAPDDADELVVLEDLAGAGDQRLEQPELEAREREELAAQRDLAAGQVDPQDAVVVGGGRARGRREGRVRLDGRAAQDRPHARDQLAGGERLDDVVVGAGVEAADLVPLGA